MNKAHLYSHYRYDFLNVARKARAEIFTYELEGNSGSCDVSLATNVATLGLPAASNTVIISSGIHGVELPFGSVLQQHWLPAAQEVCLANRDVRFVFVHALNPFGAAHDLRNDQDNIDPNRNFVDFSKPQTTSENYRTLADAFAPAKLSVPALARAWGKLLTFGFVTHGIGALKQALAGGQYDFPDGLYYGGIRPSWTREKWQEIVHDHVVHPELKKIWHIDIHTGEGPRGKLQLMVNTVAKSPLHQRVSDLGWADNVVVTNTSFAALTGDIVDFWPTFKLSPGVVVTPLALEVGTSKVPSVMRGMDVLNAMIARNVLKQRHNDFHRAHLETITRIREVFSPSDPAWEAGALAQGDRFWKNLRASVTPRI